MDVLTLCDSFCDYSRYMRGLMPDTITKYRTVIRLFCRATTLQKIEQCTEAVLREFFYRGRSERYWSSNTFVTYQRALSVFFAWCVTERHLEANPVAHLERPRIQRALPQRLSADQAQAVLERIANYPYRSRFEQQRDLALIAIGLYAGLRRRELLKLKVADIDVEHRSIFVREGKGGKDRIVPLNPALAGILERYLVERRRVRRTCPSFLTSAQSDRGLSVNALRKILAKLQRITKTAFRAHTLRHSFATLMLEGGCDLFSLSRMMGHNEIRTTTLYLAASPEHLRAQMAKHPLTE